jgi:ABC-type lipoprotein release transport system permease subunit
VRGLLLRLRGELRQDRRAWVAGALLLGVLAGAVIATAAAARRTDTALPRWRAHTETMDVWVGRSEVWGLDMDLDRVDRLPEVVQSTRSIDLAFWARTDEGRPITVNDAELSAPVDGFDGGKNHPIYLQGRAPDPKRPEEVYVGMRAAEAYSLRLGSTITVRFTTQRELERILETGEHDTEAPPASAGTGLLLDLRVVGITADIQSENALQWISMSRAFMATYGQRTSAWAELAGLRLRRGDRDLAAVRAGVERLADGRAVGLWEQRTLTSELANSVRLQVRGLWALAILGGLALLLLVAQAVSRRTVLMRADQRVLATLGMTRAQLVSLGVLRFVVPAAVASVLAIGLAIALSPLAPFGAARIAEPDRGVALDVPVLAAGGAAVVLLTLLAALPPAWRASRSPSPTPAHRSAVVALLARRGVPATVVEGVRMALEPARGRARGPVRSTLVVSTVAVAVAIAGLTVTASVDHLLATPRLYGQDFDATIGDGTGAGASGRLVERLRGDRSISELSMGAVAEIRVDGVPRDALAMNPVRGSVGAVVLEGRLPKSDSEILLGATTADELGKGVGDVVTSRIGRRQAPLRVVGLGVLPEFGTGGAGTLALGNGAAITFRCLRLLDPEAPLNIFLLRVSGGDTALTRLHREHGAVVPASPAEVGNWGGARGFPVAAILLVMVAATAIVAQALVTSVRGRRRDVAVFKILGFERRQVRAMVAWHATTVAAVALVAGVPLGVAAGRLLWRLAAEELGVIPEVALPWTVLLAAPITVLLANLVAWPTGRLAARTPPIRVLRTE